MSENLDLRKRVRELAKELAELKRRLEERDTGWPRQWDHLPKQTQAFLLAPGFRYLGFNAKHQTAMERWFGQRVAVGEPSPLAPWLEGLPQDRLERVEACFHGGRTTEKLSLKVMGRNKHYELSLAYWPHPAGQAAMAWLSDQTEQHETQAMFQTLLNISEEAGKDGDLRDLIRHIHQEISQLVDATNFYLALYRPSDQTYTFPYHVDEKEADSDFAPQAMPNSLTDYVRRSGLPLLAQIDDILELERRSQIKMLDAKPLTWMGVPLVLAGECFGVIVLQSYRHKNLYSHLDLDMMVFISDHVAMAIKSKKRERQILENQSRMKIALAMAQIGNWEMDTDFQTITFSQEASLILGFGRGATTMDLEQTRRWILPEDWPPALEAMRRLFADDKMARMQFRVRRPTDGKVIHLRSLAQRTRLNRESRSRVIGLVQDVTEQKAIEESLLLAKEKAEESDRLKSAFLANMSHEIRTPMNSVVGFSELLAEEDLPDELRLEYIQMIQEGSQTLLNLITDIIDISKIQAGQMEMHNELAVLAPIFDELLEDGLEQREKLKKESLELLLRVPAAEQGHCLETDGIKLKQVLGHFLSNALKFTLKGQVVLGYEIVGEQYRFFVEDTGIGMPTDQVGRVFERFGQARRPEEKLFRGTGLGLSIAKSLVELLGGRIEIWTQPEVGTRVSFSLPRQRRAAEPEGSQSPPAPGPPDWSGRTVLLVADDTSDFFLLREALRQTRAKVLRNHDIEQATQLALANSADVLLVNLRLAWLAGEEALAKLKKSLPGTRLLALCARGAARDKARIAALGFDDCLAKPLNPKKLIEKLSEFF